VAHRLRRHPGKPGDLAYPQPLPQRPNLLRRCECKRCRKGKVKRGGSGPERLIPRPGW
jgi:hypothetical protein